jgi:hypothetical protein
MPTPDSLRAALAPLARIVASLDLCDPAAAEKELAARAPASSLREVEGLLLAAREEGWLTPRDGGTGITFGRLAKPGVGTAEMSIDAVDMEGEAAEHTHPAGEVSFCVARSGEPRFDGRPPGWVVLPPGSHHTPTVRGGRMLIVYFLPRGEVVWGPET